MATSATGTPPQFRGYQVVRFAPLQYEIGHTNGLSRRVVVGAASRAGLEASMSNQRGFVAVERGIWNVAVLWGRLLLAGCAVWCFSYAASAREFVVTSYGEGSDAFPGDGVAEIQPGTGVATLHAAIEEANAFPGHDSIRFDLPVNYNCRCPPEMPICKVEVSYARPLPPLTDPAGVTIDGVGVDWFNGASQDAALGPPGYDAFLVIQSSNNIIRNIDIIRYPQDGIVISGPNAHGNTVEDSRVGTACPGVFGVGRHGIVIERSTIDGVDGGASANVIYGNAVLDSGGYGIVVRGEGSDGNIIAGNHLGQSPKSTAEVCGIHVDEITERTTIVASDQCTRAHLQDLYDNYASPSFEPNAMGNIIIANGASDNIVGGAGIEDANFLGGGVWARDYTATGEEVLRNQCINPGETELTRRGNDNGIVLEGEGTTGNRITGNHIGYRNVAVMGTSPENPNVFYVYPRRDMSGHGQNGIVIRGGASGNTIGDAGDPALGNRIRYNFEDGIRISGAGTDGNRIYSNDIASEGNGITIQGGAMGTVVGAVNAGNYIGRVPNLNAGGGKHGVEVEGAGTSFNEFVANTIDGNGFSGMAIHDGASNNRVGGSMAGEGNLIHGNCSDGIVLYGPNTTQNQILGNEIRGAGEIGVFLLNGASENIIGGSEDGAGNNIYDNGVTGVEIHDAGATANRILGNDIHENGTRGVFLVDGTSGNEVGGEAPEERNRIYNNATSGIEINGPETAGNSIRINSIYDNGDKGIFLSFGANNEILPPEYDEFIPITGTAAPNTMIDLYSDAAEEGRDYIGSTMADENGAFSVDIDLVPYIGTNLTSTATDENGNTSEFNVPVPIDEPAFPAVSPHLVVVEGDPVEIPVDVTGSPALAYRWQYSQTEDGTYNDVVASSNVAGINDTMLQIVESRLTQNGYYRLMATNGLGSNMTPPIRLRVVGAGLDAVEVNSVTDVEDGNTSSFARLLTEPGDDGVVSLREAIAAANIMEGPNTISFTVEGTIQPESALPDITDMTGPLTLDGGGLIVLDGAALTGAASGLTVTSAENQIKGIAIVNFPEQGLVVSGPGANNNVITGSGFGTDGENAGPNGLHGLLLEGGAHGNQIGGDGPGEGNQFSGNQNTGITLTGAGTNGNRIEGNEIGRLAPDGPVAGHGIAGIHLLEGASSNIIGGGEAESGNTITGNAGVGVWVVGDGTTANTIRNNTIFDNDEMGIRLFQGGNGETPRPVITSIDPIRGTAAPGSLVDCYADLDDEGEIYLDTVTADSEGIFTSPQDVAALDGMYITAVATDSAGNTSAFSLGAPVDFSPPEITLNGEAVMTVGCGGVFDDPGVLARDNIDGNITANVVRTIVDADGAAMETLDGAPPGTYTVRYDVTDSAGYAADRVTRQVIILDSDAPELVLNGGGEMVLACGAPFDDPGVMIVDGCDADAEVSVDGSVDVTTPGVYSLTYRATDNGGNTGEPVTRQITVMDNSSPEITLVGAAEIDVSCGAPFDEPGAMALDACDGEVAVSVSGSVNTAEPGTYVLRYEAADSTGNAAQPKERVVNVVDQTAPVLMLNGASEVTLRCGDAYAEAGAVAVDDCDRSINVAVAGAPQTNIVGVYTITYSAADDAGNVAETITRTVTVSGEGGPQILLNGPPEVTLDCDTAYTDAGARAVDACLGDITEDIVVENPVVAGAPGVYRVTYNVMDGAGTPATEVVRTVTIRSCDKPCDAQCTGDADNNVDVDGDGLSKCKEECVGTRDTDPDSDGDGMSDGYEYRHELDPTTPDGHLDPDLDGVTNFDEFLENASPRNPAEPVEAFFVSPNGVDSAEAGTRDAPWQTLAYALGRVNASEGHPVRLYLHEGTYEGTVTLDSWITLMPVPGDLATITGSITAMANSTLRGLDFQTSGSGTAAVYLSGGNVAVRDCVFDGSAGVDLTGIVAESGSAPASWIGACRFQNLAIGIDVAGPLPAVTHCIFENEGMAGIVVRDTAQIPESSGDMGAGLNGWNDFSNVAPGLAVINEHSAMLAARFNEWGATSDAEIDALTQGQVDTANALPQDGAASGSAMEIIVWTAGSQRRVAGASVEIAGAGATLTGSANNQGRLSYPALASGTYEVNVSGSGHQSTSVTASLEAGMVTVVNVALTANGDPGGGGNGGDDGMEKPMSCSASSGDGVPRNWHGDITLVFLLIAVLAVSGLGKLGLEEMAGRRGKG